MSGYETGFFPAYGLTATEADRVHFFGGRDCEACGDTVDVLGSVFREHLEPEGFDRVPHASRNLLVLRHPSLDVGNTGVMFSLLGLDRGTALVYRVKRDRRHWQRLNIAAMEELSKLG